MHITVQMLWLTAALRARITLDVKSPVTEVILPRTMKSRNDGAAKVANTATTASVTSSSIRVMPRLLRRGERRGQGKQSMFGILVTNLLNTVTADTSRLTIGPFPCGALPSRAP
jgi:hypothetical protein